MARATHQHPNLQFVVWDYRTSPPAEVPRSSLLVTIFGIDFAEIEGYGQRVSWALDITQIRESAAYRRRLVEARPYFANWRSAALDDATLVAVLRVSGAYHTIPVLDAAAEAGWRWQSAESRHVQVDEERFPLLVFQRAEPTIVAIDDVLAWLVSHCEQVAIQPLTGAAAWVLYRALEPKVVVHRHTRQFDDGTGPTSSWALLAASPTASSPRLSVALA